MKEPIDFGVGKEKILSAAYTSKSSLLLLLVSGRTMRLLNEIVLPLGNRDRNVLTPAQLGNLSDRRAVTSQPIGDDPFGEFVIVDQSAKKASSRAGVTVLL